MGKIDIDKVLGNSEPEFECGSCGKNSVKTPGLWCSECQIECIYIEEEWYKQAAKCLACANAEGPDRRDYCAHYEMPLFMVKRKNRCKHYEEPIPEDYDPTYWMSDDELKDYYGED